MENANDVYMITKVFRTKEEWCKHIHYSVADSGNEYIETIIEWCEVNGIEYELVHKLIDDNIKEKIRKEAETNNLLKPIGRLF